MTTPLPAAPAATALLSEIVDDAGLFPPASLGMDDAVNAHLAARDGEYRWMLARFLCPLPRLPELAGALPSSLSSPLRLGVVVPPAGWVDDGVSVPSAGWAVEAIEARLPDDDVGLRTKQLADAAASIGAAHAWLEVPWTDFPLDRLTAAIETIASAGRGSVGVKVRCGGETADAVPPPSVLAVIVVACRDAGVRMKATAGLHHPFRHPDPSIGAVVHGFINLAAGAVLARHRGFGVEDVAAVLSEDGVDDFRIADDSIAWRDNTATVDEVADTRRSLFAGFGSCNFREPVDDLVAFGVLT